MNKPVNSCKMDVEGEDYIHIEKKVIMESIKLEYDISSYYQEVAYDVLSLFMKEQNIPYWCTKRYLHYPENSYRTPVD